ncbi:MAG: SUMF1/EgtB/PvdO family nonheme iron enzyme, partial [Treponema sp.]|nr:SUMF1/EgtB/PvdO family nonheme iron enzyme [Treponema sp.]
MGNDSHFSLIDGFEMMLVNAGTFKMGAEGDSGMDDYDPMAGRDEKPAHQVTLTLDYYIGVYPVTQKQWIELMGDNPSKHKETQYIKGDVLRPVENVSFIDVQGFISKLNEKTGKKFRLPTEAEWEYAARGGYESKGYKYSGGSDPNEVAWNGSNAGMSSTTKAVGTKKPNELGIYDMSGNVFEWVNDRDGAYTDKAQTDPAGPEQAANAAYDIRITRGGYYNSTSADCRVSCRKPQEVNVKKDSIGFRLALTSDTQSPRKQAAVPTAEVKQPEIKAIDPAIEGIKQEIMAHLSANFGPVAGSMMDGYSQNPASVNLFFWNTIKQGFGIKSASDAPAAIQPEIKTGDSSGGNPAIEEIKQEIKARLEATYGPANAAVTGMMMNTYINSPEAGKLEFWQKIRESVGGQAAPVDPRRKQKSGDWEFIEDGDTVTVIRYWGKAEQVDIPAEINGKPVTRIDESAMDRNDFLDTVTIPGSVTEIACKAFDGSAFMRHITIPDSVVSIGERAFNGCNLLSVTLGK